MKVLQIMEAEGIEPNVIMLNILINAFGIAGRHLEALSIYHHIIESVRPHPSPEFALKEIHWLISFLSQAQVLITNTMSQLTTNFQPFHLQGISPDVVTYTTLMKACIRAKKYTKVCLLMRPLFDEIIDCNICATSFDGTFDEHFINCHLFNCSDDETFQQEN